MHYMANGMWTPDQSHPYDQINPIADLFPM